ncbi:glycosyltransferase family 4 protein [Mucilaginibacter rubeus]|uniref:Glycosyltransferase family 4 protein n=1 Tax=Mucilaginibacter rubeus TaxID=2027860 RepID=A0A5C1I0V1_9SPHI|nr:glycosyltransferase family 4 protein [Mucilaginibacter rubeus]QEM11429.1 glycosyltransferase family 4 protein [Mucilaginibacter rubeus]
MRLAIITTHPIQYYAPVFKLLSQSIEVMVFYTWGEEAQQKFDPGFGKTIAWDIPLLDGYPYQWVKNTAPNPGSHHFKGIVNPDLINQVKNWQPDAILIYGWAYNSHLKVIRHFKNKIPLYFRGDSTLLDGQKGIKNLLRSLVLRWVYSHVNYVFYVGTNNKAYFQKYGLKSDQLFFAPHAIDNNRFEVDRSQEATNIRSGLGIKPDDRVILFAGKLEEKKSPQMLLDAFLSMGIPNAHLLFVGNGPLENSLKASAADSEKVHFLPFQNQSVMPAIYQSCNIFCLPSKGPNETWGLAVNEAMAAGRPVLVSDKCGCAIDLVDSGINGEMFEAGSRSSLIQKLSLLLENKTGLSTLGNNAKTKVASWSFEIQAETILKTLKNTYAK